MSGIGGENRKEWSSSFGFIIACVGSAVGLGNIWKFPYITYENGGGAFVLVYLLSVVIVAFPIMAAEMVLGRSAKLNAYGTFKKLSNNNPFWKMIGGLCIFSALIILSYYSVIAGWTADYFINSLLGNFQGLTAATVEPRFIAFVSSPLKQIGYHSLFMFLTAFIVLRGTSGIEKAVKVLMPALAVLVLIISGISMYNYGVGQTLDFLFTFDLSTLKPSTVLEGVGQAFFTLSLGLGVMLIYGSYLPRKVSLVKAGIWITVLDTFVAFMACMMMYPIIFGSGMEVNESAAILFTSLTIQFNSLPGGSIISALFYLLVAFAALSSTISLLEVVVAFFNENYKWSRRKATVICATGIWFLGLGAALGNGAVQWITDLKFMDRLDYLAANWSLPIGGMFIAIFAAWYLSKAKKLEEFSVAEQRFFYPYWQFSIKFLCPVLVFLVILHQLGVFG